MIPMVDLKAQYKDIKDEIDQGVLDVLANTQFILGPNVQAFEREAAEILETSHAITCASGTDALHLSLLAAGIGPGDEVITTPFTFIATAEAIRYVGATPVFVDIDGASFNIDPAQVAPAIGPRTRAVLPVHLFGQPASMDALTAIAERHGLIVIEDCSQSFGARYDGRMTGGLGALGTFSFYPSKNLGCYGDGGMVTTNDDRLAERVRMLRNHGSRERYYHEIIGYNSRLDELQAVILRIKLRRIHQYNLARARVADKYDAGLAGTALRLPWRDPRATHVFHQYTVVSPERDALQARLREAGIGNSIFYPIPLHRQEAFAGDTPQGPFPVAEATARQCLSLPMYPEMSDEAIEQVCATIRGETP